jgi:hypothetical protein
MRHHFHYIIIILEIGFNLPIHIDSGNPSDIAWYFYSHNRILCSNRVACDGEPQVGLDIYTAFYEYSRLRGLGYLINILWSSKRTEEIQCT